MGGTLPASGRGRAALAFPPSGDRRRGRRATSRIPRPRRRDAAGLSRSPSSDGGDGWACVVGVPDAACGRNAGRAVCGRCIGRTGARSSGSRRLAGDRRLVRCGLRAAGAAGAGAWNGVVPGAFRRASSPRRCRRFPATGSPNSSNRRAASPTNSTTSSASAMAVPLTVLARVQAEGIGGALLAARLGACISGARPWPRGPRAICSPPSTA